MSKKKATKKQSGKKKAKRGADYEILVELLFKAIHHYENAPLAELKRDISMPTATYVDGKPQMQQIDVFWSFRHGPLTYNVVVEAKNYKRRISKSAIRGFHAVLKDLQQNCVGVMVTTKGFQSGAEGFARQHGIELFLVSIGPSTALRYKLEVSAYKTLTGGSVAFSATYLDGGRRRSINLASRLVDPRFIIITDRSDIQTLHEIVGSFDFAIQRELEKSHTDRGEAAYNGIRERQFSEEARIRFPAGTEHQLLTLSIGYKYAVKPVYKDVDITLGFDQFVQRLGEDAVDGYAVDYSGRTMSLKSGAIGMCDFCPTICRTDDGYKFEMENYVTIDVPGARGTVTLGGPWGGCSECSALVLAGDREGLLRRAERLESLRGTKVETGRIAGIHKAFWLGYNGRFERQTPTDEHGWDD